MRKFITLIFIYTMFALIILPSVIVLSVGIKIGFNEIILPPAVIYDNDVVEEKQESTQPEYLEDYIKGVVGAEMPALFNEEALKAQAVAARTYALRAINNSNGAINASNIAQNVGQAYMTVEQLKQKWGDNFDEYYNRVSNAVDFTKNEIMEYNDEPILAVFHSTSRGKTENSENVWNQELPYLRSVDSQGDEKAPNYETSVSFQRSEISTKLRNKFSDIMFNNDVMMNQLQILERTDAGYVKSVKAGNKVITGKEMREALGLRSADFTISQGDNCIIFTTRGYGHGAGMSQYGAEFMAEEGYKYDEILKHYYSGIEIVKS